MRLNRHQSRIDKKYIVLIVALCVCLAIGILSVVINDDRSLSLSEKVIKDIGVGVENVLYAPIRFVESKIDRFNDMKRIYNKYKDIDKLESKTVLINNENKELKQEVEELKKELNLNKTLTSYTAINATVINRNVGNWYNTLTLDKGTRDGAKNNMIVVSDDGLIGKIIKTTFNTSEVKLITTSDLNSKISVGINSSTATTYGLLSGYDSDHKQLIVSDIIDGTTISAGDKVVTSGLSGSFPSGIIVGTVAKLENDEFGISKVVKVTPSSDFNSLRYVTVLKGDDK